MMVAIRVIQFLIKAKNLKEVKKMRANAKAAAILLAVFLVAAAIPVTHAATSLQIQSTAVPQVVSPGNEVYVQVTITNTGLISVDTVRIKGLNVDPNIVQVTPTYLSNLGSLGPSKTTSTLIKFRVPQTTSSGFYPVTFSIEACQSSTICDDYTTSALITVQAPSALEIKSVSPDSLIQGDNGTLSFVLSNVGDTKIDSILMSWSDSTGKILPLGSDNRKFIQSIGKNSDYVLTSDVIVSPDAQSGVYPISITFDYTDQTGTPQHIESTVGLRVIGSYSFVVSLDTQDVVASGTTGSAEIKIANAGTQDAQFLTVGMLPSDPLQQITPSVIYVGTLKSNDYDTEKIQFSIASNTVPGAYPMNVEMTYKDPYGQSYHETHAVNILVSPKSAVQAPSSLPAILLVVAIVIVVLVYLQFRRTRKKKEKR